MSEWISATCAGEFCSICDEPAYAKVGEEISYDDPGPKRHNLTAYVCRAHFEAIMGKRGVHFRMRLIERGSGPSEATHDELNPESSHD